MLVGPSLRIAPKQPCRLVRNASDQANVRTKNYQVGLRHWGPGKHVAATVVFVLVIIIVIGVIAIVFNASGSSDAVRKLVFESQSSSW